MSLMEAVVLGVIQGLTEFLPISSTAHLCVVPQLFGWKDPGAAFTAVIQLGTLVAVLFYFRSEIARLFTAFLTDLKQVRYGTSHDAKLAWMIAAGTIPIVILGLAFKDQIRGPLRQIHWIAAAAIGFAVILGCAEMMTVRRAKSGQIGREEATIGWRDALFIGFFQAFALIPGASRSGVTITAGLFAGLSRSAAARFSFLLSLPAVFGAAVYEMWKDRQEILASPDDAVALVVATIVSGLVGYASIAFLIGYLRKHSTWVFIVYRLILGAALLALLGSGVVHETSK
jgi:undecaprenyl-diphosphatase